MAGFHSSREILNYSCKSDDVLAPVALAIQVGATLDDLAAIFAAHPTLSELAFAAARAA